MVEIIEDAAKNTFIMRGEYSAVLPAEQTLNHVEVEKYFQKFYIGETPSKEEADQMVENLLRQPIMADIYRKNKIKPSEVSEFIETIKAAPMKVKGDIVTQFWTAYGNAARSNVEEINGLKIGDKKEWTALNVELSDSRGNFLAAHMRRFKKSKEAPAPVKKSFTQKVMNYVKHKGLEAIKTLATGTCDNIKMAAPKEFEAQRQPQMSMLKKPKINS